MNKGDIVRLHPEKYASMSEAWGMGVITGWVDWNGEGGWRTITVRWMGEEVPPEDRIDTHLISDLVWVTSHATS